MFWDCLLTYIPHRTNPLSRRAGPSVPNTVVNHKALSVRSLITLKSLLQNGFRSVILPLWLITFTGGFCLSQLFRKKMAFFVYEEYWESIMTYHRVFKYLPQVIVIMRNVIIGCGNEPPKVVTVCYVHEDSLQQTGKKVQSVSEKLKTL